MKPCFAIFLIALLQYLYISPLLFCCWLEKETGLRTGWNCIESLNQRLPTYVQVGKLTTNESGQTSCKNVSKLCHVFASFLSYYSFYFFLQLQNFASNEVAPTDEVTLFSRISPIRHRQHIANEMMWRSIETWYALTLPKKGNSFLFFDLHIGID